MTKHTPGPWKFSAESIDPEWSVVTTAGGSVIANVNDRHDQPANASLIAAAPDMLEALKEALSHLDENARFLRDIQAHAGKVSDAFSSADKVRAAIAKAEGKAE